MGRCLAMAVLALVCTCCLVGATAAEHKQVRLCFELLSVTIVRYQKLKFRILSGTVCNLALTKSVQCTKEKVQPVNSIIDSRAGRQV